MPQSAGDFTDSLHEEGLAVIEMNELVSKALFFHLPLDIARWEVDRFVTQAESPPMNDH